MNYRLSPSDLTFLYDGCQRCFYLKVVKKISQPSIPLPAVFTKIASLLKNHFDGKRTNELYSALPPGKVILGEKWVKSQIIQISPHNATCQINGRFDIVIQFDDGSYGVVDFKTGNPESESSMLYSRQLHAYAFSLEHPAHGSLALAPISKLGLLYFYPEAVSQQDLNTLHYDVKPTWIEIPKDEGNFLSFISEVLGILTLPQPPECSSSCQWCDYVKRL